MREKNVLYKEHGRKTRLGRVFNILIPTCVLIGAALGIIYAGWTGYKGFESKVADILLRNANNINNLDTFLESLLKYGKYAAFIWLMAFVPYGYVMSLFALIIRGFGYGYTTGLLLNSFGKGSVKYVILLYLPQMLISFFGYYYVAKASFSYSSKKIYMPLMIKNKSDVNRISRYFLALLIAILFEIICGLIEMKITRNLLDFV